MLSWPAWAIPRRRAHEPLLIMAKPDRSRLAPTALAVFGIVVFAVLGVLLGVVRQAGWISLLFSIAFALALLVEIAGQVAGVDSSIPAEIVAGVFACFGSDHPRACRVSGRMGGGSFPLDFLGNLATCYYRAGR
jgi:hypothetical protein